MTTRINVQKFSGHVEVASNLTVDATTFHVDSMSNRIGVGTTLPSYKLDVNGTLNSGALTATTGTFSDTTHSTNKDTGALIVSGGGLGVEANIHTTNVFAASHIAIGTSDTTEALDVRGTAAISSNLEVGTANLFVDTQSGRVGMGTTLPKYTIDVHGSANVGALSVTSLSFDPTDDSTSTTTGAFKITGGIGVTSNVHATNVYASNLYTTSYVIHRDDIDTKIGFPADDTFTVTTAGTERVRVDSNGNVGIGKTPGFKLDVNGTLNSGALTATTGSFSTATHSTSKDTGALIVTTGGLGVEANIHSTNVFAASHIGIGTSDTTKALDVRGTANVGALTATSVTVPNEGGIVIDGKTLKAATGLIHWDWVNSRLGIGTTSPSSKLHINPNTTSTASPSTTGLYVYNENTGDATCTLRVKDLNAGDPYISFDVAYEAGWTWGMDNDDGNKMKLSNSWNSLSSATKMTIDTSGNLYMSGGVSATTGTFTGALTAPTVTVPNDGDFVMNSKTLVPATGMYWDRVNSRLGVGTTSPSEKLHVNGRAIIGNAYVGTWSRSSDYTAFQHTSLSDTVDGNYALLQYSDGTTFLNTSSGTTMYFREDNATKMVLKAGKVGIGTTEPSYQLDVHGETGFDGSTTLRILNPALNYGRTQLHIVGRYEGANDAWSALYARNAIMFKSQSSVGSDITDRWTIQSFPNGTNNDLGFMAGTDDTPKVVFRGTNGNVGIGTTDPIAKLHIGPNNNDHIYLASANNNYGWKLDTDDQGGGEVPFRIIKRTGGGDTTVLAIKNQNGDVGIGTTNPSMKLQVEGTSVSTQELVKFATYYVYHHRADGGFDNLFAWGSYDNNDFYNNNSNFLYVQIPAFGGETLYTHSITGYDGSYFQARLRDPSGVKPVLGINTGYTIHVYSKRTDVYGNITTRGNVGIGTTAPGSKLHIEGASTSPIIKGDSSAETSTFNYILNGPRPGTSSSGAVHFINGSTRADDGGASTYTIRNDSGQLRLGSSSYDTIIPGDLTVSGKIYNYKFTEVDILYATGLIVDGTWTTGDSDEYWGNLKFNNTVTGRYRYNDAPGYVEYVIPAGMKSAYISQLTWDTGGYVDVHGVQSDGGLVFLRRINTRQTVENWDEGNPHQHDGQTITFIGTGLETFSNIRLTNKVGRFHLDGLAFTPDANEGGEGTGMVHSGQISDLGSGIPTASGTGASGTWGIDISGNAATASSCSGNAATATSAGNANTVGGISANHLFNNMGLGHGTYTDFNTLPDAGSYYLVGATNGPEASGQFYGFTLGLGTEYGPVVTGAGNVKYGCQLYWKRNTANPYIYTRALENGGWGSWSKMSAGYADTATNQSGGSVSATTGTFSGITRLNQFAGSRSGTFSGSGAFYIPGSLDYGAGVGVAPAIGWEIHLIFGFSGNNGGTCYIDILKDQYGIYFGPYESSYFRITPGGGYYGGSGCYLTTNRETYGGVYYAKIILAQAYNNNVSDLSGEDRRYHMTYQCVGCLAGIGATLFQGSAYFRLADSSRRPAGIGLNCTVGSMTGNYMINALTD